MLACAFCVLTVQGLIFMSAILGGWSAYLVFRPFALRERMARLWGVPQFGTADFASLFLLLTWPSMLARIGREHSFAHLAVCFGLFAACTGYLWLRGLWILQQVQVKSLVKRTLFLSVLVPGAIVFSLLVGLTVLVTMVMLLHGEPVVLIFVTILTLIGGFVYSVLQLGLTLVFGRPVD
jgi:hypothetical protein